MTLLILLLVLAAERVGLLKAAQWQPDFYFDRYQQQLTSFGLTSENSPFWHYLLVILAPVLLLFWLISLLGYGLLYVLLCVPVLMVLIGHGSLREQYKCYMQAASRDDIEACHHYADALGHQPQNSGSFALRLVWLNYQYYAAVIIWYVVFGLPGALLYVLTRMFEHKLMSEQHPVAEKVRALMVLVDWIPVRIAAFGLLMVGHFSRAFPLWLRDLLDPEISAYQYLTQVARQAEDVELSEQDLTKEPIVLVGMVKRNMIFLLVALSVLTLMGWVA
jgi:AmpE protein